MPSIGLSLYPSRNGQSITDGPILTAMGGEIVLEELGQFSPSSVVLAASDERAVLSLQPYTLLEIVQEGVGTLGWGYILDAQQQITSRDESTITLQLEPLTVECTWRRTEIEWTAANYLSVIAARLGSLTPNWTGRYTLAGGTADVMASVNLPDLTAQAAFLQVAETYGQYARMGRAADGTPTDVLTGLPIRALEMGPFGAGPPLITLVDAKGGDAAALPTNDTIRVVSSVEYHPGNASDLMNVCVPYGGGSSSDTLVTLERLWRIINDPTYINVGRWGSDADSIARTGKVSVFPEYDPAYPIANPLIPATGAPTYDANGNMIQGGNTTRGFTTSGRGLYYVYDAASYALYGHKQGPFVQSDLTYADTSVGNQELTQRALYAATIAEFKRYAHPHETFTCTAEGRGRPPRAGDLVGVDCQRVSVGDYGAVIELNVQKNLIVTRVTRRFDQAGGAPEDTYVLSNVGRFDRDDATRQAETRRQIIALQFAQGTSMSPYVIGPVAADVDALHPLEIPMMIPAELFRWHAVRLRVDFQPYRATSTTGLSSATPVHVTTAHGTHSLTGTFPSQNANIPTLDTHVHAIDVIANTGGTPNLRFAKSGDGFHGSLAATSGGAGQLGTNAPEYDTNHAHTTPITGAPVTPQFDTLSGTADPHQHPLDQRIPDGLSPVNCEVSIDGALLSSGLQLTSGGRNADGTLSGSAEIANIGPYVEKPGQTVMLRFKPGTSGSNQYGVGRFSVTLLGFVEFSGLPATVLAS